jgi:hypothetical protein
VATDPDNTAPGTAVFARHGAVRFRSALRDIPRREIARLAALPHAMPMLAQQPLRVPHLRVTATRSGGEVLQVPGEGGMRDERSEGPGWPVHKPSAGGWSQARYQRSAEHAWEVNAKELAAQVAAAAEQVRAEHIIVAGDIRARALLLEHLDSQLRRIAVVVDREVPADSEAMAEAAEAVIAGSEEQACRDKFAEWHSRLARASAVEGLADTLAALSESRAADVFIADEPRSVAEAWIGPGGTDVAATADQLTVRGVSAPVSDRADAAIVRAIACTDAELFFLPGDLDAPREGIGATLRYPAAPAESGLAR